MRFSMQLEFKVDDRLVANELRQAIDELAAEASPGLTDLTIKGPFACTTVQGAPLPIRVFVDGACHRNPGGAGGWGYRAEMPDGTVLEACGGESSSTNNRMELQAAVAALEALPQGSLVIVTTDSKYVKNGITEWVHGWIARGWRTYADQPVKNRELWERLLGAAALHQTDFKWTKGHAGHSGNERAHDLANQGMRPFLELEPVAELEPA